MPRGDGSEHLGVAPSLERATYVGDRAKRRKRRNRRDLHDVPDGVDGGAEGQFAHRRNGERALHEGEVRIAGRAHEQGQRLLAAGLVALGTEPRAPPIAGSGGAAEAGLGELPLRRAAPAAHPDVRKVSGGAFIQDQPRMRAGAPFVVLVREADPRDLLKVPLLARRHEAHRHARRAAPPVIAGVKVVIALALEAVPRAHEGAAARVLAHEPRRELHGADAVAPLRLLVVARGGRAKRRVGAQLAEPLLPASCVDARAEPRLAEHLHAVALPEVQAADDHGVADEIDHGARSEARDELAAADLAVGLHVRRVRRPSRSPAAHAPAPFRESGRRSTQMCAVASTSRIDVGAAKRASSVPSGGTSASRAVKSRGFPL